MIWGITQTSIASLSKKPHNEALAWRWARWKHKKSVGSELVLIRRSDAIEDRRSFRKKINVLQARTLLR